MGPKVVVRSFTSYHGFVSLFSCISFVMKWFWDPKWEQLALDPDVRHSECDHGNLIFEFVHCQSGTVTHTLQNFRKEMSHMALQMPHACSTVVDSGKMLIHSFFPIDRSLRGALKEVPDRWSTRSFLLTSQANWASTRLFPETCNLDIWALRLPLRKLWSSHSYFL